MSGHRQHVVAHLKQIINYRDSGVFSIEECDGAGGSLKLYNSLRKKHLEFARGEETDDGYFPDLKFMDVIKFPYAARERLKKR